MLCNLKRRYEPTFDLELIFQILDKRLKGVLLHHLDPPPSTFQPFSQTLSPSWSSFSNLLVLLLHHLDPSEPQPFSPSPSTFSLTSSPSWSFEASTVSKVSHQHSPLSLMSQLHEDCLSPIWGISGNWLSPIWGISGNRLKSYFRNLRKLPQVPFQESQEIDSV